MRYLPATDPISVSVSSTTYAADPVDEHDGPAVTTSTNVLAGKFERQPSRTVKASGCDGLGRALQVGARASLRLRSPQGTYVVVGVIRNFDHDGIEVSEGPVELGMYHKAQAADVRLLS